MSIYIRHAIGQKQLWIPIPRRSSSSTNEILSQPLPPFFYNDWTSVNITTSQANCWVIRLLPEHNDHGPLFSDVIHPEREFEFNSLSPESIPHSESMRQIEFDNGSYKLGFDCQSGNICTYQISHHSVENGRPLSPFVRPVQFNFYRAPTDNDRGGGDKQAPLINGLKQVGLIGAVVGGVTVGLDRVS